MVEALRRSENTRYAPKDVLNNIDSINYFLDNNCMLELESLNDDIKKDKEVLKKLLDNNLEDLKYVNEDIKNDEEFMLSFLKKSIRVQRFLGNELKNNKNFICNALKNELKSGALQKETIGESLWDDFDVIELLINQKYSDILLEAEIEKRIIKNDYLEKILSKVELNNIGKLKILKVMDKIPKYRELLETDIESLYTYSKILEEKPYIIEKVISMLDKKQIEESLVDLNKENNIKQNKKLKF